MRSMMTRDELRCEVERLTGRIIMLWHRIDEGLASGQPMRAYERRLLQLVRWVDRIENHIAKLNARPKRRAGRPFGTRTLVDQPTKRRTINLDPDATVKVCARCREAKAFTEFHRAATGRFGRTAWCKACYRAWAHEKYPGQRSGQPRQPARQSTCPDCGQPKASKAAQCQRCSTLARRRPTAERKVCPDCSQEKPLTEFYMRKRRDGSVFPRTHCKQCHYRRYNTKKS